MMINNTFQTTLPPQQISLQKKLENKDVWGVSEWQKQCLNALESLGRLQFTINYDLKENYELIRGRFIFQHYLDKNDYFDLTSAVSQQFNLPNYLKHYDITSKAVNVLVGEFIKRPDGFRIRANDKGSFNEFVSVKNDMLQGWLSNKIQQTVSKKLAEQGIDVNRDKFKDEEEKAEWEQMLSEKQKEMTPAELEKYMTNDYFTAAEKFGQHIVELDKERFNTKEKDAEEFEDSLVADRCFRHFCLTATGYNQETWNPLQTFFHRSPEVKYIENGDYVGRVYWLSKAQILDRFGWLMNTEQIEALYPKEVKKYTGDKGIMNEAFSASMYPFEGYRDYMTQVNSLGYDPHTGFPFSMNNMNPISEMDMDMLFGTGYNLNFRTDDIVQVTEAYWRSQRRLGKLNYTDPETGKPASTMVDETFNPKLFGIKEVNETYEDSKEPNTVCWTWTTQIWKGIKINVNYSDSMTSQDDDNKFTQRAMYIDIKPAPVQFKGDYSPFHSKLPVIGQVFNNRNGQSMSLVDLLKPYQIFYNVCLNQAYELSQREIGKFILMDMNILPNLKDWGGGENFEKFLAVAKGLGIGVVDTRPGANGQTAFAASNSYQVLDASESDRIAAKVNLGILIEQQAYKQIGITDARMGQIAASQTATGVEQSVSNSYSQTESYFEKFNNYKRRVLQANVEIAQYVYAREKDITLMYTMSDLSRGYVTITDPDLLLRDLGVYPTFSQEITRQLETIRQLALNNNTANIPLSGLAQMLTLNSTKDIVNELKNAESKQAEQQAQQAQQQQQLQQQALEAQAKEKQLDRENAVHIAEIKAANEIQKVTLSGIANEGSFSQTEDLTDKLIAQKDLALKEQDMNSKNYLAQQIATNQVIDSFNKKKLEETKMQNDKSLKDKEHKSKQEVEKSKLEQINAQSKNQEKLAKDKHEHDLKLQREKAASDKELANKQLELKEKDLQIKELDAEIAKDKANLELKQMKDKLELEKQAIKVKVDSVKQLTEVKIDQQEKLAQVKTEEVIHGTKLKMKENEQQHSQKMEQNTQNHKLKLTEDKIKSKQRISKASKNSKK
jgi:hypothetical protein